MSRPRREGDHWVWLGGPVPPGSAGITLGRLVIISRSAVGKPGFDRLMRHELVHVRQWRQHGIVGFSVRYLGAYLRWRLRGYGHWAAYRRIPYEVEATWEARLADGGVGVVDRTVVRSTTPLVPARTTSHPSQLEPASLEHL